jgi:hypothetical protein
LIAMRALSICQPWASLLALGLKRLETRSWRTAHRGPLALHAARSFPPAARALCAREPFCSLLRAAGLYGPDALPLGAVVGAADLVECVPVEELDDVPAAERPLGDFGPGRWVWRLARASAWPVPVPARGRLGVFDLPALVPPTR